MPSDHKLIFLEKDQNVIAVCRHKGCNGIIFIGSDRSSIGNRVLRERVIDHMAFFDGNHDIDIIYPRAGKKGRIIDAKDMLQGQYTIMDFEDRNFS